MYLACTTLGLTLEQAITAATINAAYSINLSHRVGAITEGRQGDFVVINTKRCVILNSLAYVSEYLYQN